VSPFRCCGHESLETAAAPRAGLAPIPRWSPRAAAKELVSTRTRQRWAAGVAPRTTLPDARCNAAGVPSRPAAGDSGLASP
jgi:hypothetical protein